jgi:hypothetical protein
MLEALKRGVDPYGDADAAKSMTDALRTHRVAISAAVSIVCPWRGKIVGAWTVAAAADFAITINTVGTAAITHSVINTHGRHVPTDPTSATFVVKPGDTIAVAGTLGTGTGFIEIAEDV